MNNIKKTFFIMSLLFFPLIFVHADTSLVIKDLSPDPAEIKVGETVTFKASVTDFVNPAYIIYDSFIAGVSSITGSTISNTNINTTGDFSWTPKAQDVGIHNLIIRAIDFSGRVVSANQIITVDDTSTGTGTGLNIKALYPGQNVNAGQNVSFVVVPTGLSVSYYEIFDSFGGSVSTITNSNINNSGIFNWVPTANDRGTHDLRITANDSMRKVIGTTYQSLYVSATKAQLDALDASKVDNTIPKTPTTDQQSSTPAKHVFYTYLESGDSGVEVTELQKVLVSKGFLNMPAGVAYGYYGSLTTQAVKNFQQAHSIETLGVVGPQTRNTLNNLGNSSNAGPISNSNNYIFTKPLSFGMTNTEVTELQKKMTSLGVYAGPITGYFGPLTEAGVKELQRKNGLTQLGSVGPGTRAVLNR